MNDDEELEKVRQWLASDPIAERDAPTTAEWTAIERRIFRQRGRPASRWLLGGAIAAGLVGLGVAVTILASRGHRSSAASAPSSGIASTAGSVSVPYRDATRDLEAILRDNRSRLRPETIRALEASLATIDSAIAQAQRAIADDPANDYIIRYLDKLQGARISTLRDAVTLLQLRS